MSFPIYVVNFDELLNKLSNSISVEANTQKLEDILNKYFPQLLELLGQLVGGARGVQKINGFATKGEPITFSAKTDILVTGITISQNNFDLGGFDKWKLELLNDDKSITLLEDIYSKDILQHKYFERFLPVPIGYKIVATITKNDDIDRIYWIDIEYLEL